MPGDLSGVMDCCLVLGLEWGTFGTKLSLYTCDITVWLLVVVEDNKDKELHLVDGTAIWACVISYDL